MPISAYLPDPDKWINTASPSSSSIKPKQRHLTSFRHGLPTPPTSHPRARSRSTKTTDENATKSSSAAGPSRLRDDRPGGLSGYFTPPMTSSVPRKQRIGQIRNESEADSSKNRGSPTPRAGGKSKGTPLKVKSRLAEAQEEMDYWNSEDEDAGPSKPRRKSASKRSPPVVLPPSRKNWALDAFSSGELTDLPPEYMDDDDPVHISKPLPKKRNLPATTTSASPVPVAPTIPSSRLAKLPSRSHPALPPRSPPPAPTDADPPSPTQAAASPRLLTQPPKAVLAQYWRMNGLSSDRIGQGEETWGRSAGYVENEERRKAAEKKKREEEELERELEGEVEKAKEAVERVGKVKKHLLLEDTDDEDVMPQPEPSPRGIKRLKRGEDEKRIPLSPLRTNTSKRGIRTSPPGSPSPRKKRRREPDGEKPIAKPAFIVREDDQPGPSTISRGRPSLRSRRSSTRPRNRSRSLSIVDRIDIHLQSVMEEAKLDAKERDLERAKQHFLKGASTVRRPSTPEQVIHPPKARRTSQAQRRHSVTPPKRRGYTDTEAKTLFAFTPPPQPDFTSSPRSSQERKEGEEAFRPVEVNETLMTWSLGGGREGEVPEGPVDGEEAGEGCIAEGGRRNSRSTHPQPGVEETQSIPSSTYSHSFPNFVATQSIPSRPAQSGWSNLNKGILAGPSTSTSTSTDKQPSSGPTRKRKSVDTPVPPQKGKQSRLEAFGIVKEKPERQMKDFEEGFDDEPELEESYVGSDEHVPQAGPSRPSKVSRGGLHQVPEAPYHPDLRPAGIRALRARQNASYTDRFRAERVATERSSPPLFSPPSSPVRPTLARNASDVDIPTTPGSVKSPVSSSLLTDSTDDEAPGVSESMKAWWDGLGDR